METRSIGSFFSGFDGFFQVFSLSVGFTFPKQDLRKLYRKLNRGKGTILKKPLNWADLDQYEQTLYLTDIHEFDHFNQLTSSPAGVFMWRLIQCIVRDISYFNEKCRELDIRVSLNGFDLYQWWKAGGRSEFRRALESSAKHQSQELGYFDEVFFPGLRAELDLLYILTSHQPNHDFPDLTVEEFLKILSVAFKSVGERCDVPWAGEWQTELDPETAIFDGESSLNITTAVELLATFKELRTLQRMNATSAEIDEWEKRSVPDGLISAYRYFLAQFDQNPSPARAYIRQALCGPIDHLCTQSDVADINIERAWPFWRSQTPLKKSVLEELLKQSRHAITSLASSNALFGPASNWRSTDEEVTNPYLKHLERTEEVFLKNLGIFANALSSPSQETQNIEAKLGENIAIIEYSDCFNDPNSKRLFIDILWSGFYSAYTSLALSLAVGHKCTSPASLAKKFEVHIAAIVRENEGQLSKKQNQDISQLRDYIDDLLDPVFMIKQFDRFHIDWEN